MGMKCEYALSQGLKVGGCVCVRVGAGGGPCRSGRDAPPKLMGQSNRWRHGGTEHSSTQLPNIAFPLFRPSCLPGHRLHRRDAGAARERAHVGRAGRAAAVSWQGRAPGGRQAFARQLSQQCNVTCCRAGTLLPPALVCPRKCLSSLLPGRAGLWPNRKATRPNAGCLGCSPANQPCLPAFPPMPGLLPTTPSWATGPTWSLLTSQCGPSAPARWPLLSRRRCGGGCVGVAMV